MARRSSARLAGGVLIAVSLPLGASFFVAACGGTDATQEVQPVAQVEAGELSAVEVSLHQAVG